MKNKKARSQVDKIVVRGKNDYKREILEELILRHGRDKLLPDGINIHDREDEQSNTVVGRNVKIFEAKTLNDLSKQIFGMVILGEAQEIKGRLDQSINPLGGCSDRELMRYYKLTRGPGMAEMDALTLEEPSEAKLEGLISEFLDRMSLEKNSTASIIVRTMEKMQLNK